VITIGILSDFAVFNISTAFWDGTVVVAIIETVVEEFESSQIELEQPWQPFGQSLSQGQARYQISEISINEIISNDQNLTSFLPFMHFVWFLRHCWMQLTSVNSHANRHSVVLWMHSSSQTSWSSKSLWKFDKIPLFNAVYLRTRLIQTRKRECQFQ